MAEDGEFRFAETYKVLQPTADRTIIAARETAHQQIRAEAAKDGSRVAKIGQLAFAVPTNDDDFVAWFEALVREKDASFSLASDGEEARIIATLVLFDLVISDMPRVAAYVLALAIAGHRKAPGNGLLEGTARTLLSKLGRQPGLKFSSEIAAHSWTDLTKHSANIASQFDASTVQSSFDALVSGAKASQAELVGAFNKALQSLTGENRRLAEEVDLLWWHLGQWSYLLDRPLAGVDNKALPFVIGCDVAAMVNILPGPYGAFGIIEKALGPSARKVQTIEQTLRAIGPAERKILLKDHPTGVSYAASLHAGLQTLDDDTLADNFASVFAKRAGLAATTKLTQVEFASQAYFERMFIRARWH